MFEWLITEFLTTRLFKTVGLLCQIGSVAYKKWG